MSRSMTVADLIPQEAAFLAAYFELGASPRVGAEAARRAGYADQIEEAERVAAFLLGSARITRAIKNEIANRFTAASGAALAALVDVCENGQSESARITAANSILDRGVGPVMSRSSVMTAQITVEDFLAKLDAIENGEAQSGANMD